MKGFTIYIPGKLLPALRGMLTKFETLDPYTDEDYEVHETDMKLIQLMWDKIDSLPRESYDQK